MAHHLHAVAQTEGDEGIGPGEIVAVLALPRVDELPLHVVLGGDLVEMAFHQGDLGGDLFGATASATAGDVGTVEGRADLEMLSEGFRERWRLRRSEDNPGGSEHERDPGKAERQE